MSIDPDANVFPNNAIDIIVDRVALLDADLFKIRRPLRDSDPSESVGIYPTLWNPDAQSVEMRGVSAPMGAEASIQRYTIMVQAFVKDFDEVRGVRKHTVLSKMIRTMMYRDAALGVGLAALETVMSGSTERSMLWGIGLQRFLSNEIDGQFLYLSTLEFWLETETV